MPNFSPVPCFLKQRWQVEAQVVTPFFFEMGKQIRGPAHTILPLINNGRLIRKNTRNSFAKLMTCRYVTANPLDDLYGVEYAAVMKNIIALACGITHGLGYGDNFQAVLVSNAMQEIGNFVTALDPRERNMSSSAYLGDLLVTAYSQFSRNRLFGNMIGRGYSVKAAQLEMKMIAEGYYATKSITEMNKIHHVSLPITNAVHRILYEEQAPGMVMDELKKLLK